MNEHLKYAAADTLVPLQSWVERSDDDRLALVRAAVDSLAQYGEVVEIVAAAQDGQIIIRFLKPVSPDRRGTLLLDLEDHLKSEVDIGLTVWLEPLGDKNSLRNLRGIKVK